MNRFKSYFFHFFLFALSACKQHADDPGPAGSLPATVTDTLPPGPTLVGCKLERYVPGQTYFNDPLLLNQGYLYNYSADGRITNVVEQVLTSTGEWEFGATDYYTYKTDSVIVSLDSDYREKVWVFAHYKNDKIDYVNRFFFDTRSIYHYVFDYSVANQVMVTHKWIPDKFTAADTIDVNISIYHFDNHQNVDRTEVYEKDLNSTPQVTSYTYDDAQNPIKGVVFPTFIDYLLPDVDFFSTNNRLQSTSGGATINYNIAYDAHSLPLSITSTPTDVKKFSYKECK